MYKIYVSYDMREGKEEDCQRYFSQVLGPTLNRNGATVAEVWYTIWGNSPQFQSGSVVGSQAELRRLLSSTKWREVLSGLEPLVTNLNIRTVRAR